MKSEAGVPVAYAMHAFPERYALLPGAGVLVAAGLPTARDTARYRIAFAEVWAKISGYQTTVGDGM